jgi:hypothetical protein
MVNTEIMKDFLVKVREWENGTHNTNVATRLIANMDGVQRPGIDGICWEWDGSKHKDGYGQITCHDGIRSKTFRVHRLSLSIASGYAPTKEDYTCHKCDNKACFNPDHLYWGDARQNSGDYARRGKSKIRHLESVNASVERTKWWNKYKNQLFEEEYLKNPLTP